ncbi:MAG TPA: GGDEF domain-containing protein [Acidimicrobiales bacterium]|jgi:diguanylate cyclase (GGDEF)-like protein
MTMGPDPGGPGGVPADIAARLVRALDTSPSTVVALISEDLRNLWVSRSVAWVLGDDPATVMTEKALTRVHPDDVHRLLHGLAQAKAAAPADEPGMRVVEPLRFRVERPDGGWVALESLVINLLDDPLVHGLVAIVRPVGGEVEGVGRVVDLLVADAPLREVLAACAGLVPDYVGSAAVVAMRHGHPVIGALAGTPAEWLSADDRWWRDTLADRQARTTVDHAGFPDELAIRARDAGFRSTWVLPLCDVAADEVIGCLVVWVRIAAELNITNETGVRQAERLAGLVIGEQRRRDALRHEALTDPLTRVANRSALRVRFETSTDPLTVAIIDLDGFKLVNDTHGHEAGDAVLQVVAQRIVGAVRQDDLVVRLGGDEFAIVFAPGTTTDGMGRSLRRVIESIGSPIQLGGLKVSVGASAGLATGRPPDVMQEADRALYEAKGMRG